MNLASKERSLVALPEDDASILARVAAGEMRALGDLYERHAPSVFRFVARSTGSGHDVEDIVHNTFLTVSTIASRYDGRLSCRSWLIGIAARLVDRRGRSLARLTRMVKRFGDELRRSGSSQKTPETFVISENESAKLHTALNKLTEAKRVVLVMAELEEMRCEDIAAALEIPLGTVWTRLHHARRELRVILDSTSGSGASHKGARR